MTNEKASPAVEADRQMYIVKRRSSRRNRILMISGLIVLILALIIISLSKNDAGPQAKELKGTWIYNENTSYSFNGRGKGSLDMIDVSLRFTYYAENGIITIDFEDVTVQDCQYLYRIDNDDVMTLTGGEGTTGGEYELTRKK